MGVDPIERTFFYTGLGLAIVLLLVCVRRLVRRYPLPPELTVYTDDSRSDLRAYVRSPSDFGWANTVHTYEFALEWVVDDRAIRLKTVQVRRGNTDRGPEHDLFYRPGCTVTSVAIGWGMKGTLDSGTYRMGARVRSKYGWSRWKWTRVEYKRLLSLQENHVGGDVRCYLFTPTRIHEVE